MKKLKKQSTYYSKVPKAILSDADLIMQLLMQCDGQGVNEIMQEYFKPYWGEFCAFWAQSGEQPEWLTFALAPHNSNWFIIYVFQEYPDVRVKVMNDYNGVNEDVKP